MKTILTSLRNNKNYLLIIIVASTFFALLLKLTIRLQGTDDYVFGQMIAGYHNVAAWVTYRYSSWSGRIFSEGFVYIFTPLPLYWWKIVSLLSYIVLSLYFYLYYLLFSNQRKNNLMLILCFTIPFLMNSVALFDGMFWVTGAMNYFWIATLGVVGFYPFVYYFIHKKTPRLSFVIVGVVSGVIAACSQEQVGALMSGLAIAGTLYIHLRQKLRHINWPPIIYSVLVTASFYLSISAPGNQARLRLETARWLPTFFQVPLLHRLDYSYRWLLDALINHTGLLLPIIWILYIILVTNKKNKAYLDYAVIAILGVFTLITVFKGYDQMAYLFNFYASWQPSIPNLLGKIIVIPWSLALIATILAPLVVFRKKPEGIILAMVTGSFICSTAVVALSPTLYASGWRTLYVPSIELSLILIYVLHTVTQQVKATHNTYIFWSLFVLASTQYGFVFMKLLVNSHLLRY